MFCFKPAFLPIKYFAMFCFGQPSFLPNRPLLQPKTRPASQAKLGRLPAPVAEPSCVRVPSGTAYCVLRKDQTYPVKNNWQLICV